MVNKMNNISNQSLFSSLARDKKEAIALLSIGTFLEYFDIMLYVHMAIILNQLFFPETDPYTYKLISATAFCSAFIFRPFGALVFGYIGDHVGRKPTVVITTTMMALSCIVIANLPTYNQIGITATLIITCCRIIQGVSCMGEILAANLYLTEYIKPPVRYPAVCLMICAANFGTLIALGCATTILYFNISWRIIFWLGASIALVGSVARTKLRETPEFIDAKRRIKSTLERFNINLYASLPQDPIFNKIVDHKTSLAYFFVHCAQPACFYFIYIYCSSLFQDKFNYTAEQIIQNNLMVSIIVFLWSILLAYLSYKIYPLKIVKTITKVFSVFILLLPWLLSNIKEPFQLFAIQIFFCLFGIDSVPADAIFFIHFPVFKRFTYSAVIFALSRTVMYIITSFGFIYLTKLFDYWGLLFIFIPLTICFIYGILHFEKLEHKLYRTFDGYSQYNFI